MTELITIKKDEALTDSLTVAKAFGKRHDRVVRAIENLTEGLPKNGDTPKMFHRSFKMNEQNSQKYPMYYMNRDGFSLLVMGFTGKKALKWKLKYINAFNQMEKELSFRKADKQIQKNSMQFLCDNLQMPTPKDYMKANTIADKCVSNMNGYPKMVKKADMTPQMLEQREGVLAEVVELMTVKEKYNLDISVSGRVYERFRKEG